MKTAKSIFAILFLSAYLLLAGDAFFRGSADVLQAAVSGFPSGDAMAYAAETEGAGLLPMRLALLEAHARLQLFLGKTESGGLDVVAAEGGSFIRGDIGNWDNEKLEQYALRLHKLQDTLDLIGMDTKILFIGAQSQMVKDHTRTDSAFQLSDQYPLTDALLYYMRGYGIDYLEISSALGQTTLLPSEYIYRTDAMWTTQAAFLSASALVEALNSRHGAGMDQQLLAPEAFYFHTHDDLLLGEMGMRAGEPFTGREDYTVISPAYPTHFTISAKGDGWETKSGAFDETLLHEKYLTADEPYAYSASAAYMEGGAHYLRKITNHDQIHAPNALFIHDASALSFASFAALGFRDTHLYWPALAPEEDAFHILAYVLENDIDFVFILTECSVHALEGVFQARIW